MPDRDPRVDPQPGDVLRVDGYEFTVGGSEEAPEDWPWSEHTVILYDGPRGKQKLGIGAWRELMQNAEVIHAA